MAQVEDNVKLPTPSVTGEIPLEHLLEQRRSIRDYSSAALTLAEVGQLLWAAQGITDFQGFRTAPSAGALYPLELFVVVGRVENLEKGVYHYKPEQHQLQQTGGLDMRDALAKAALSQFCVKHAAVVFVFTAVYERTKRKYGNRGIRYVHIEIGHAAQNLFLQSGSLGLATVVVGAFDDAAVATVLNLDSHVQPLLLMPVGRNK